MNFENLPVSSIKLGRHEITITKLSGFDGFHGWQVIQESVAPMIGTFFDAKAVDQDIASLEKQNTFEKILSIAAKAFNSKEHAELVDKMLEGAVTSEGQLLNVDEMFRGEPHLVMKLVLFLYEENFKCFFTDSSTFGPLLGKIMSLRDIIDPQ